MMMFMQLVARGFVCVAMGVVCAGVALADEPPGVPGDQPVATGQTATTKGVRPRAGESSVEVCKRPPWKRPRGVVCK